MRSYRAVVMSILLALAASPADRNARAADDDALTDTFYALCMDTHDSAKRSPEAQAKMLADLGYDGAAHLWLAGLPERLRTLDEHKLKLVEIYVRVSIDPKKRKFDPRLKDVLPLLKDRGVMLSLLVSGGKPSDVAGDARAVEIIREIADMAEPAGVRVTLYPHTNDWLERVEDAVRVAEKVKRKNVGATFNLCHWLKVDKDHDVAKTLKAAVPHLFAVSINGADAVREAGWDRLIQPLDSGDFDISGFLKTLKAQGYDGPIGLQCYGIRGDAAIHLKRSMTAWLEINRSIASDAKRAEPRK